jgi:cold-inducible RNA-binding protein
LTFHINSSDVKVFVGNLPFKVKEDDLKGIFTSNGVTPSSVTVATGPGGRAKGFGFVFFSTQEEADKAIKLNGIEYQGRPLQIAPGK